MPKFGNVEIDCDLPADGLSIHYRAKREKEWSEGVVDFCWLGIEPAIKLTTGANIFPTLGDEWLHASAP